MNQETKTVPTSEKKLSGGLDSSMDEKICAEKGEKKEGKKEYSLESKKIPARALENGLIAGAILAFINLTGGKFFGGSILNGVISILEISVVFALFVFFVSLCILRSKLNTKYKIPNKICTSTHNKTTSSSSSSLGRIWSSNLDLDSTMPGSAAHSTRQVFDKMRRQ